MGVGDYIMATGDAWAQYLADDLKRKVAIGDGTVVDWNDMSDGLDFLATQSDVNSGVPVTWVYSHLSHRPYIDYEAMEAELERRGSTSSGKRKSIIKRLGHYIFKPYKAKPGRIAFDENLQGVIEQWAREPFVAIEPYIKANAPPSKQWGWDRWVAVSRELSKDIKVVQVSDPRHHNTLPRAHRVRPHSFKEAAAYIAASKLYVGPEGGQHHAAAALGKPAVVIFGGFTDPKMTGYDFHVNLDGGADYVCGTRYGQCPHCAAAMSNITPEEVVAHARRLLGQVS